MPDTVEVPSFSEREVGLIESMGGSVEVALRPIESCPDLDAGWHWLTKFLEMHDEADKLGLKLRYAIGKFLLWAKSEPSFYTRKGFTTYSQFISEYVCQKMGFSRASLYQARSWAERMPNITPNELDRLGATKATLLASYSSEDNSNFEEYRAAAHSSRSAVDFQKWVVERSSEDPTRSKVIMIRVSEPLAEQWAQFKADGAVHERVGSDLDDRIFECLLQEASYWFGDQGRICSECNGTGRI